ncbi:hexokinase type 2-like [Haliotis cracherodii]|uniref:hexokinase type 2-like n=1 Tax=Haliotis cracherodii TaxID=6455 RepID=UPI0039EB5494
MEAIGDRLKGNSVLSDETKKQLGEFLQPLVLPREVIERIMAGMEDHIKLANSPDRSVRDKSDVLMANTHVRCLLDGKENGTYLGLDLGGSNFRVVKVIFTNGEASTKTSYYTLTDEVRSGPCDKVFEFIAISIKDFLEKEGLASSTDKIPLGFTFSFPTEQYALNRSKLLTWTKTFKNPDGPGRDPVQMLEQAIQKETPGLPVDVVAVMSDTTSTLMAGNYLDKKCRIGLILGTGFNIAFVEHVRNIEKWTGDNKEPTHVLVNIENGSLGDGGSLDFYRSEFEKEVDKHSNHPNSFTFEKSFSGHYLGELVRLVLVKLIDQKLLLGGATSTQILERWNFTTTDVTKIVCDKEGDGKNARDVLSRMELNDKASDEDVEMIRQVALFMSKRGAYIVASALAVCVRHVNLPEVTVAIDGSVYEHHPTFHPDMTDLLEKLAPQSKVKLILAKDGSGQGAAFVAVSALRQRDLNLLSA